MRPRGRGLCLLRVAAVFFFTSAILLCYSYFALFYFNSWCFNDLWLDFYFLELKLAGQVITLAIGHVNKALLSILFHSLI